MKRIIALALSLILALSLSAALCESEKVFKVGIAQFAVHGSLDNCRLGFIEGMKDAGFEEGRNVSYEYQNAQTSMDYAIGIANKFVSGGFDLIAAIATPMAVVSRNAADSKIPVIYTASPKDADLDENGLGKGDTTGTSDHARRQAAGGHQGPCSRRQDHRHPLPWARSTPSGGGVSVQAPELGFAIGQWALLRLRVAGHPLAAKQGGPGHMTLTTRWCSI